MTGWEYKSRWSTLVNSTLKSLMCLLFNNLPNSSCLFFSHTPNTFHLYLFQDTYYYLHAGHWLVSVASRIHKNTGKLQSLSSSERISLDLAQIPGGKRGSNQMTTQMYLHILNDSLYGDKLQLWVIHLSLVVMWVHLSHINFLIVNMLANWQALSMTLGHWRDGLGKKLYF